MTLERLPRELGTGGAVLMGLGAMIGTGIFVSIGLGAGLVGPAVLVALALAAGVALCNGLSSAQLAAAHPVSGGTYEYGHIYLGSRTGFTAGWVFLVAKSASAATAALGFSGYLLQALSVSRAYLVATALGALAVLAAVVLAGMRRSNLANAVMVSITLSSLVFFAAAGAPHMDLTNFVPFFAPAEGRAGPAALLEATALMFVAYTGYARIATLGEEVREPRRTIPRAIIAAAVIVMFVYTLVAVVGIGVAGTDGLRAATDDQVATLAVVARGYGVPFAAEVLVMGALAAMLGVLLNLLLGLSRVALAMARRGDLPRVLAHLDKRGTVPPWAVLAMTGVIAALVLLGDVRTTWSFSAFSVLIYYAITNLCALRMPAALRLYPRWIAVLGLVACTSLAFWVQPAVWLIGCGLIAIGLAWHAVARRAARPVR